MKIAICFSGQLRTWEKCLPTWTELINRLNNKFNTDVDIFFHAWDFNTVPEQVRSAENNIICVKESLDVLVAALRPSAYLVEDFKISSSRAQSVIDIGEIHKTEHGGTPIPWAASQYYSLMRSAHLKKLHETKNKFRYDICIRLRFDLFLAPSEIDKLINDACLAPAYNTIYATSNGPSVNRYPPFILGDIFWVADSLTFDRMCDFYKWMPVIGLTPFPPHARSDLNPELLLYYYTKMLRISVSTIHIKPKICRFKEYIDQRIKCNLSAEIYDYEII